MNIRTLLLPTLALSAVAAQATPIIVNGNFENDAYPTGNYKTLSSLTGWTILGDSAGIGKNYLSFGNASQEIDLSGVTDNTSGTGISQAFMTNLGQAYKLSFDVFAGPGTGYDGGIDAMLGASTLGTNLQGLHETKSFDFVGTGSMMTLKLLSNHGNVSHIDNVSVQAVPEPASMAALAVGGAGLVRRRRKA